MAHFAQLDENNIVSQVIVINNDCCLDENGNESEQVGIAFCKNLCGESTRWVQTSYNSNIRGTYASIGAFYDEKKDKFIPRCRVKGWVYNESTGRCESPIPRPTPPDGYLLNWDNDTESWTFVPEPTPPVEEPAQ